MTTRPSPGVRRREPLPLRTLGLVALGAALGSVLRQAALGLADPQVVVAAINVLGALALGAISGRYAGRRPEVVALVGTGFCGGLTTFSAVMVATAGGSSPMGWTLLVAQVALGLGAAWLGWRLGRREAP